MTEAELDFAERCWESGYRSYVAKIQRKSCPFAEGSAARKSWTQGWDRAKHEYEDAPPGDE